MSKEEEQARLFDNPEPGQVVAALSPSKRDPARIVVKVGAEGSGKGKAACTIDQKHILDLGIAKGDAWTPELARRVRTAAEFDKARRYALNLCTTRGISRRDLIDRITRRGHTEETALQIADELERIGIVDEKAYAASVARSITNATPAGQRLIEHKLRQRKIAPEAISQVTADLAESRDELADAKMLAEKRARQLLPRVDARTARRRIYAQLARRGFAPDICVQATDHAVANANTDPDDGYNPM